MGIKEFSSEACKFNLEKIYGHFPATNRGEYGVIYI